MHIKPLVAIPICLFGIFVFWITGSSGVRIPNLNEECIKCLCFVATLCNLEYGCSNGYCGPFNVSKIHWIESGKFVLPYDDPYNKQAWMDCANDYDCATKIVEGNLQRFGRDCNGDGVTDCFDYMLIMNNGGYGCSAHLNRSRIGMLRIERYKECYL